MIMDAQTLPSATQEPSRARKSAVRIAIVKAAFSRRSLLRGLLATTAGVGIVSLDMIPGGLSKPAMAAPSTYWNCREWLNASTQEWLKCNPGGSVNGNVGSGFCVPGGKYHRIDAVREAPGVIVYYYRRHYSCTGTSGGRNAWRWVRNNKQPEPPKVFCSDGRVRVQRDGPDRRYKSACRRWNF